MTDDPGEAPLARVMAEIEEEVRRRRGELPARVERELDALFLEHAPMSGRSTDLAEAVRAVDVATAIDPLVPVGSEHAGGALVKKGLRSLNLWYMRFVTHQVSQFAVAVAGALHALESKIAELEQGAPTWQPAPVLDTGGPGAWWQEAALEAAGTGAAGGRALHTACGDGWRVRALVASGVDAYGVDPRPGVIDAAELAGDDLRREGAIEHLHAVGRAALDTVVVSGVVDGMTGPERDEFLRLVADRLAPDGVLVLHSLSPAGWVAPDAPAEADLAPGHPVRPATWSRLLAGWSLDVRPGPAGADYLVVARR